MTSAKPFTLLAVQSSSKAWTMTRFLTTSVMAAGFLFAAVFGQSDTCYEQADILFVLEASDGLGLDNFQKELQFAATFVNRFVVGPFQFSVIRFDSIASIIFGFKASNDTTSLTNAILSISYTGGGTDTAGALRLARVSAFSSSNGARPGVPKVVIVCTDRPSDNPSETAIEAKNLKDSNVLVLSIGIGASVDTVELDTIATSPEDVFMVIDYDQLRSIVYNYSKPVCEADITNVLKSVKLIDGIYPDPGSCNYFIECTAEITRRLKCPEGLRFSATNYVQINYDFSLHYG